MSLVAVLDATTDDTLLAIAIALPTPADLLQHIHSTSEKNVAGSGGRCCK